MGRGKENTSDAMARQKWQAASGFSAGCCQKNCCCSVRTSTKCFSRTVGRTSNPSELPVRMQAHVASQCMQSSPEVIAKSPVDPRRADQAVIYNSALRTMGINPKRDGDNIYNGAIDNGRAAPFCWKWRAPGRSPKAGADARFSLPPLLRRSQGCWLRIAWQHSLCRREKISVDLNYDGLSP